MRQLPSSGVNLKVDVFLALEQSCAEFHRHATGYNKSTITAITALCKEGVKKRTCQSLFRKVLIAVPLISRQHRIHPPWGFRNVDPSSTHPHHNIPDKFLGSNHVAMLMLVEIDAAVHVRPISVANSIIL
jgi:hypothetical protein